MIANKKKYIFHIIMAIFILISVTISIVASFALYQYDTAKQNFVDNQFAKTIEISSYNEAGNQVRKLNDNDIDKLEELLDSSYESYEITAEHLIPFGVQTASGDVVFVKSFSGDFFLNDLVTDNHLMTKKKDNNSTLTLSLPVIKTENGGYSSDQSINREYDLDPIEESSLLSNYIKEDELIASEATFKEILDTMFPEEEYVDIEKLYITVNSVEDVRNVAARLSSNDYNVSHAFEYYDDLETSISRLITLSVLVLAILLIFTICFLTGLFELMLKNSVGDIAILKHLGYSKRRIGKIYLYPMVVRSIIAFVIIGIINTILYLFDIINTFQSLIIFQLVISLVCVIALGIMFMRIRNYASKNILSLVKIYKVEEWQEVDFALLLEWICGVIETLVIVT